MIHSRDISAELRTWRKRSNLTIEAAAAQLRVSYYSIVNWESGRPCALPDAMLLLVWYREQGLLEDPPAPPPTVRKRMRTDAAERQAAWRANAKAYRERNTP